MSRSGQVKNRAPAPIQISAEQILREAADRQEQRIVEPVVKIHDAEEYQSFLRDRRKHFEDNIRYRREHIGNWVKYAKLEEEHNEFERARSIFERALEVDVRSAELWLRYAEMEMRHEFVNRARNVLDRAVQLLPRVDFLWYKYVYMEELVGDIPKCRAVFERWMKWMPDDNAWLSYARFEMRVGKMGKAKDTVKKSSMASFEALNRAEAVLRRYVNTYPSARAFIRFAKWAEYEAKDVPLARTIYEAMLSELEPEESRQARVFWQFARFEERQNEYERARVIYKHALKLLRLHDFVDGDGDALMRSSDDDGDDYDDISEYEREKRRELYQAYISFEKKHGDRQGIEDVLLAKKRQEYQKRVTAQPRDYDAWFEYAKLEEDHAEDGDPSAIRDVYERAVSNLPPTSPSTETNVKDSSPKDHWRRYIYLWIYYAVYEELTNHDSERAAKIYETCLSVIPHKSFTFSKIWILAAQVHLRRHDLAAARKLLGRAIGLCGKERIFQEYISLELSLGEIDRCRALYTNYLKAMPQNCHAWSNYASLEQSVGETERCRAIYELAVSQPALDMPERIWKEFIDFELDEGEGENARKLYERLLERTGHVKVWISFAQFEGSELGEGMSAARKTFGNAYQQLKEEQLNEERVLLLDAWRSLEQEKGDTESVAAVEKRMPRRVKLKRMQKDENGNDLGWEEYFDYQFPDDENADSANLKILEMAAKWKQKQQNIEGDSSDDDDDDDDEDDD